MSLTYYPTLPASSEDPSVSQGKFQINFSSLSSIINANHVDFTSTDYGKHKFCQFPEQSAAPTTLANEGAVYTKRSALTAATELFFRREGNGTEIEFTGFLGAGDGWTRLPSGILLKWGTGTATGAGSATFPVAGTIPVFSAVYQGIVSTQDSSPTPNTFATMRGLTTTEIQVYGSTRTTTAATAVNYRYLVIGI